MQLRRVEERIAIDPILSVMIQMEQDHDLILSRIRKRISRISSKYQIQLQFANRETYLLWQDYPSGFLLPVFHSELYATERPLRKIPGFTT